MSLETLSELVGTLPLIRIVDVGANPLYGDPPYQALLDADRASVTGFEPEATPFDALDKRTSTNQRYLPHVVGDGSTREFWSLEHPGMSSIYEPDTDFMAFFGPRQDYRLEDEHFVARSAIRSRAMVKTTRLDDIADIGEIDYLKIDVQGGELDVFRGATRKLRSTLIIHTEALFLPMYKNQPLFADVDRYLAKQGFLIHRLIDVESRPVHSSGDFAYRSLERVGEGQLFWCDALFLRNFTTLAETTSPAGILKLALILHDLYRSYDMVHYLLHTHDRLTKTSFAGEYRRRLHPPAGAAAPPNP